MYLNRLLVSIFTTWLCIIPVTFLSCDDAANGNDDDKCVKITPDSYIKTPVQLETSIYYDGSNFLISTQKSLYTYNMNGELVDAKPIYGKLIGKSGDDLYFADSNTVYTNPEYYTIPDGITSWDNFFVRTDCFYFCSNAYRRVYKTDKTGKLISTISLPTDTIYDIYVTETNIFYITKRVFDTIINKTDLNGSFLSSFTIKNKWIDTLCDTGSSLLLNDYGEVLEYDYDGTYKSSTSITSLYSGLSSLLYADATNIWLKTSSVNNASIEYSILKISREGNILNSIITPVGMKGAAFDGSNLWFALYDWGSDDVLIPRNPADLNFVNAPCQYGSIFYGNDSFWVYNGSSIVQFNSQGTIQKTIQCPLESISGMVVVGDNIWCLPDIVDDSPFESRLVKMNMSGEIVKNYCVELVNPNLLAYDGSHFWSFSTVELPWDGSSPHIFVNALNRLTAE